jgi:dolichol-phosphate mannosyltransferase
LVSLYNFILDKCQNYEIEILLADDGSTDQSRQIYTDLKEEFPLKVIRHEKGPLGYGNTILTLFNESKHDYDLLITFDADLQHAPISIKEILDKMTKDSNIDVLSTSRYLSYRFWGINTKVPVDRYLTNMFLTYTINTIMNLKLTDAFCGLKGYRTSILPSELDHAGYSFPLVFWNFMAQNNLTCEEIETPIIYRLDRRSRGAWKTRTRDYFNKLETTVDGENKKEIVRKLYESSIMQLTEILDHYTNFPIYTYEDFFKLNWLDTEQRAV